MPSAGPGPAEARLSRSSRRSPAAANRRTKAAAGRRRGRSYDRDRLLAQAGVARRRGRRKKAIELYSRVLELEPNNLEIHRKLAPLLARARRRRDALASFARVAEGLAERGFADKAVGVCREAAGFYPTEVSVWEAIANLQLRREKPIDAIDALIEGRRKMRGRKRRPLAIRLLRRARAIDPGAVEPGLDLARLLARSGQRAEARQILEHLAARSRGRSRRRVRGALLRMSPTPRSLWRWLGSVFSRR